MGLPRGGRRLHRRAALLSRHITTMCERSARLREVSSNSATLNESCRLTLTVRPSRLILPRNCVFFPPTIREVDARLFLAPSRSGCALRKAGPPIVPGDTLEAVMTVGNRFCIAILFVSLGAGCGTPHAPSSSPPAPQGAPPIARTAESEEGPAEEERGGERIRYVTRYVGGEHDDWQCTGTLAPEEAMAAVSERRLEIGNCYERRLHAIPTLEGQAVVRMRVGRSGEVDAVSVGGTLEDGEVRSCLREVAESIRFAPVTDGSCAVVSAPYNFTRRPPDDGPVP